ncbi:vigilin [Nephila pilipes]|uniref:Vigilin n=1 Tax=Nephila pilipes TaxID=299642 RepID=A0A8X6N0D3_NEPPI|nr:vigilin [Nephila pilipes]
MKNELTIAGEKEAVANYIIEPRGQNIQEILQETDVSVELPTPDVQSDTITLRGEQAKLDPALTLVYPSVKTEYMDVPSWFHKYIIGKKGANIKHVTRDLSKVQVKAFKKETVEAAKNELNSLMTQLKDAAETTTEIDPKHHLYFDARGTKVLKEFSNDYGDIKVSFPKIDSNGSKVVLKGAKNYLEPAEQRFHEIVEDLEAVVTVKCIIPKEHHRTVLGTRGSKAQNVRRQFNVTIKSPDREKPEDVD